jgi:uncharacterized protein YjbI with pentapeptide repeats
MCKDMKFLRWMTRHNTAIAVVLGLIVFIVAGIWFWGVLEGYVDPGEKGTTGRKDVVQAFALILAGVVGLIGGIVGIANLSVSRRNLRQQFKLEDQRRATTLQLEDLSSQDAALQGYFEQMGDLLRDHDLIDAEREDMRQRVRQLARAQTLTVSARVDGPRKGALVRFLYGAGLISKSDVIVSLAGANLVGAELANVQHFAVQHLEGAELAYVDFSNAILNGANLTDANLYRTRLVKADLTHAELTRAVLQEARLNGAKLNHAELPRANLRGAHR